MKPSRTKALGIMLVLGLIALASVSAAPQITNIFSNKTSNTKPDSPPPRSQVLAEATKKLFGKIAFNIPALFNSTVNFKKDVIFDGPSTFNGKITINNQDLDLGTGTLTAGEVLAPNVIYGITAGDGISIAPGVGQKPIVTNTGVLSIGGTAGAVELTAGSGISISGTTISNTSQGGNGFGKITVGSETVSAGSSNDTVTFTAGSGITISPDTTNKKITFTSSGGLSGLTTNGVLYATGDSTATTLTPGTSGFILQSNGSGSPPSWVTPSSASSVAFNNITSGTNTSAAMVVGTGASLDFSGSGTINASTLLGSTWAVPGTIGSTTPSTGTFTTLTGTTVNGLTIANNGSNTLNIAAGKSLAVNNTLTLAGTDSTTFTFPGASGTVVTLDANQTLTNKTLTSPTINTPSISTPTISGTSTFSSLGTGIAHFNSSGVLSSSAVSLTADVSGTLPIANGGTNATSIGSAGSVAYSSGTAYAFSSAGTAGDCLTSGGSGAPTWTACSASTSFWSSTNGALYPVNSTLDLLVGGTATASAKFAVVNMNSGTPTASVSAGASGGLYVTADGTVATTAKQTLTIGSSSTGNVAINGFGTGLVHSNSSGVLTSSAVNLAGADVTGTLAVGNGGTGGTSFTSNGVVLGNGSSALAVTAAGSANQVFRVPSGGGAPAFGAIDLSQSAAITGNLPLSNGGTNANLTAVNGGIVYSSSTALAISAAGTSGQCLLSGGAGTPTWGTCTTGGGTNFWTSTNGSLYPINSTMDLFVGGTATASAKFAVLNVNSGTPVASVSAGASGGLYVTADGTLATTAKQTLTIGSSSTGNVAISGFGTGLVHSNSSGVLTSSAVNLAGADVTGTLAVGNGGTGTTTFTSNGILFGNGSSAVQVTSAGTTGTVLHGNTGSAPTFSAVSLTADVSGTLPIANGGTNATSIGSAGSVSYSSGTAFAFSGVGTSGQCLLSAGAGTPTWGDCTTGGGTNFWTSTNGSLYPINSTMDLFVGGTATTSAKFAVLNVNSGTPTASVSAGASGGLYVTSDGTLATTAKQTLTIGSSSTGNVAISGFSTGIVHSNASGVLTSSAVNLAGADVTGTLAVGNGGTGGTSFTSNGVVLGNGSGALAVTVAGSANQVFRVPSGGGAPAFGAIDLSQSAAITGNLPLTNGGTNANLTAVNGGIVYSSSTALAISAAGTSGQCLLSAGAGTPTWGNCTTGGGTNFWTSTNGSLYPINSTMDLFVGGTATTSAKFAVLNVNSGIPIASVSAGTNSGAYITADGTLATAAKQTLTIGSSSTGNVILNGHGAGIVHTNASGVISSSAINLAGGSSEVTGTLPVGNGGTGATTFTSNGILFGNGSSAIQVTSAGTTGTVLHGNTGGAPTFSAVSLTADVSGTLPIANGGTNATSIGSAGSVSYSSGTAFAFSAVGTSGQCLLSAGAGTPTWGNCTTGGGTNFWTSTNGSLYPINSTMDLFVGGTATTSAKFAVLNVNSGTPIASVSAGSAGGLYVTADGTLATTAKQTLTIGSSSTGNVAINGFGTGLVHSNSSGILTSSAVNLAGADVTGTLAVGNGGTGATSFTSNGVVLGNGSSALAVTAAGSANQVFRVPGGGGAPAFGAIDLSQSAAVTGQLALTNGGTNANLTAVNGGIVYSSSTALAISAAGTSGQCLLSAGAGTPTWGNCTTGGGTNFWTSTNGSLYPINSTMDLFVGGTATTSAKFAVLNVNSGTPVASVSAGSAGGLYVTADGTLATTAKQTLTIGSSSTGNVAISGFGTGLVHSNSSGVLTSSAVNLAGADVTGTLAVGNGGTGGTTFTSNGLLYGNGSGAIQVTSAGTTGTVLHGNTGGAPTFSAVSLTADVSGTLPIANGGTNATSIGSAGSVSYSSGTAYAFSAVGTTGQCLLSAGAGTPTWGDCTVGGGTNFWTSTNGSLYPINSTMDLFVGGTATTSAKFAVLNVSSGTPTASVSAGTAGGSYLTAAGTLQSTANQSLTLGGNSTGNIILQPQNGSGNVGINTSVPTSALHVKATSGNILELADNTQVRYQFQPDTGSGATLLFKSGIAVMKSEGSWELQSAASSLIKMKETGSSNEIHYDPSAGGIFTNNTTNLTLGANTSSTQMVLQNGGNVGIGTTSPIGALDVRKTVGTVSVASISGATSFAGLVVDNSGAGDIFTASSSGLNRFVIKQGGNVGIGNTAPGTTLDVTGSFRTSGTNTFSGLSTGIAHLDSSGVMTSSAVNLANADVTGTLPIANGGTNATSIGSAGSVAYSSGTAYAFSAVGTSGQCLLSAGAGTPTWGNCTTGGGTNFWTSTNGSLYPINSTMDLFVGGTATTSAKFAVLNVNSGTPTASVSAGTAGGLYMTADGKLATTAKQTLTLGDSSTTGNVIINPSGNVGIKTTTAGSLFTVGGSTGQVAQFANAGIISGSYFIAFGDGNRAMFGYNGTTSNTVVQGIGSKGIEFNVNNGTFGSGTAMTINTSGNVGIGTTSPIGTLDVRALNGTSSIASIAGATTFAGLVVDNSGTGDIFTASSSGLNRFVVKQNGNVGIGTTTPTALLNVAGSFTTTGTNTFSGLSTGIAHLDSSGVMTSSAVNLANSDVTGTLPIANGGTNATSIGSAGSVSYSSGTAYAFSAVGTSGQCLLSGGAGTPTWGNCTTGGGTNFWTSTNGSLYPINSTMDLFVGGTATTSAKFAVLNVNSGTPTASLSAGSSGGAYLRANGELQTTANQTLTVGGTTTGNIILAPLNYTGNVGINTALPTAALDVASVMRVRDYAESTNGYSFNAYYDSGWKYRANGAAYTIQTNVNADKLSFEYGASGTAGNAITFNDGIVLDSANGNVGIGTNAPTAKLDVAGTASVSSTLKFRTGAASIQSTANNTLTIGGNTTGNIVLSPLNGSSGTITFSGYGAGILHSNSSGVLTSSAVDLGSSDVTGTLLTSNGGTGLSSYTGGDMLYYTSGTAFTKLGIGGSGTCLTSNGSVPSWGSCGGSTNYWTSTNGSLYPINSTMDLFVGGTATTSAKFAALNMNSGTPTASLSAGSSGGAYLNASGKLATTARQTLTLGDSTTTGHIVLNPAGNIGIGTTNPGDKLVVYNSGASLVKVHGTGDSFNYSGVTLTSDEATDKSWDLLHRSASGESNNFAIQEYNGTDFNQRLVIKPGGNVGIGTTSPTALLDVAGTASVSGSLSFRTGSGTIQTTANNTLTIGGNSTGNIIFQPLNGSGNIGIGTTTPGAAIQLGANGSASSPKTMFIGEVSNSVGTPSYLGNWRNDNIWGIGQATASTTDNLLRIGNVDNSGTRNTWSSTQNLNLAIPGNVGIGLGTSTTLQPTALDVRSTKGTNSVASISGATSFASLVVNNTGTGDLFTASTGGQTRFVIGREGNVGIGIAQPGAKFDVTFSDSTADGVAAMKINNTASGGAPWYIRGGATGTNTPAGGFSIADNGGYRLSINSSGNVGIGTNTTNELLTHEGRMSLKETTDPSATSGYGKLWASSSNNYLYYMDDAGTKYNLVNPDIGARVYNNANISISTGTDTALTFNSEDFDTDSMHSTSSNTSRVTINKAGKYLMIGHIQWAASNDERVVAKVRLNGSTVIGQDDRQVDDVSNEVMGNNVSTVYDLAVNDYVELVAFQNTAATLNVTTNSNYSPVFIVMRIDDGVGADVAEWYQTPDQSLESGEIVTINPSHGASVSAEKLEKCQASGACVMKSKQSYDSGAIGIVSTLPDKVLGSTDGTTPGYNSATKYMPKEFRDPSYYATPQNAAAGIKTSAIALAGRVPVKVSTINGEIKIGDPLTSSPIPGVAMKATQEGSILGKALENYKNSDPQSVGKILVFVNNTWFNPARVTITDAGNLSIAEQLSTDLPMMGGITSAGSLPDLNRQKSITDKAIDFTGYITEMKTEMASFSARFDSLKGMIADLDAKIATSSSLGIPTLADSFGSATISGDLSVGGKALFNDIGITGKVSMGLLSINGMDEDASGAATINTLSGSLKIQSLALNGVEFENGKVTIDTDGNIVSQGTVKAKQVTTEQLNVEENKDNSTIGTGIIKAGQLEVMIPTEKVTTKSKVFVTPRTKTGGQSLIVTDIDDKKSFTVEIEKKAGVDIKFDWWIVN